MVQLDHGAAQVGPVVLEPTHVPQALLPVVQVPTGLKQGHLCKSVILVDLFRFDMNECQQWRRQSLIWLIVTPAWQQRPLAVTGQRDMTTSLFIKRFSLNNRISVARNIQKIKPESFYAHSSHQK